MSDPWVIGSARVVIACYLGFYAAVILNRPRLAIGVWIAGALLLPLHVAIAFDRVHDWSHTAAVRETARQTHELTGWNWGGGVWVNHAVMLLWAVDAGLRLRTRSLFVPLWWTVPLHVTFAVIVFSATVVFGPPFWMLTIPLSLAGLMVLAAARRLKMSQRVTSRSPDGS